MRVAPAHRMRVLAVLLAASLASFAATSEAAGATHDVQIDGFAFKPSTLTVKQGDTVVWHNADPVPHTVTSKTGGFASGSIAAGASYRLVPKKKGRFDYTCTFHPVMKGELVVE